MIENRRDAELVRAAMRVTVQKSAHRIWFLGTMCVYGLQHKSKPISGSGVRNTLA